MISRRVRSAVQATPRHVPAPGPQGLCRSWRAAPLRAERRGVGARGAHLRSELGAVAPLTAAQMRERQGLWRAPRAHHTPIAHDGQMTQTPIDRDHAGTRRRPHCLRHLVGTDRGEGPPELLPGEHHAAQTPLQDLAAAPLHAPRAGPIDSVPRGINERDMTSNHRRMPCCAPLHNGITDVM